MDCKTVQTLLPAYADGWTDPETTQNVRAHLEQCPICQSFVQRMSAQQEIKPADESTLGLAREVLKKGRKKQQQKRNKRIMILAALLLALVIFFLATN